MLALRNRQHQYNLWRTGASLAGSAWRNRQTISRVASRIGRYLQRGARRYNRLAARRGLRTPFQMPVYQGPTRYVRARRIWKRRKLNRPKNRLVRNKGYRHTLIKGSSGKGGFKSHALSNRALTNLLLPMSKEITDKAETRQNITKNTQHVWHYEHLTHLHLRRLLDKSQDNQNIQTITDIGQSTKRDTFLRINKFVRNYKFQNTCNNTISLTLIEAVYKRNSDYEITDQWTKDLEAQFGLRDAIATPNGEIVTRNRVGERPFKKYDRITKQLFRETKRSTVTLEPGQTLQYAVVIGGRAINLMKMNENLSESGGVPEYVGGVTKTLLCIANGQMVVDSTDSTLTGYGAGQLSVLSSEIVYYRAHLRQLLFNTYKNADEDYSTFVAAGEHINPTDENVRVYTSA